MRINPNKKIHEQEKYIFYQLWIEKKCTFRDDDYVVTIRTHVFFLFYAGTLLLFK
jgi:hypothetical protein